MKTFIISQFKSKQHSINYKKWKLNKIRNKKFQLIKQEMELENEIKKLEAMQ